MDFELTSDYIELIKLLKITGIAESGGMAKQIVENEEVLYNGVIDTRKRLKLRKGDQIKVHDVEINLI
jgi:ribosome-associated protein